MAIFTISGKRKPVAEGELCMSASGPPLQHQKPYTYERFAIMIKTYSDKRSRTIFNRMELSREEATRVRDYLNNVLETKTGED